MKIRLAKISDLEKLKSVFTAITNDMREKCGEIWNDYYPCELFENDIKDKALYIAEEKGEILSAFALYTVNIAEGFIDWADKNAKALYVDRFGVNVGFQRKGIAVKMLDFAVEAAREKGIGYLRLFVVDRNFPAIALYEKYGFKRMNGVFNEPISDDIVYTEFGYEMKI